MVAWFPLEPTTGTIAEDITALGNDGLFGPQQTGGPLSVPGVVGGGYLFNGQGDFIQVPPSASTDFGCKPFSIDLWVKRAPPSAGPGFVNLVGDYGPGSGGWVFGIDESTGLLELLSESNCPALHRLLGDDPFRSASGRTLRSRYRGATAASPASPRPVAP
jgi:hypothetical protein